MSIGSLPDLEVALGSKDGIDEYRPADAKCLCMSATMLPWTAPALSSY